MNRISKTHQLTFIGAMLAITIILLALPSGGVILLGGNVSATVAHIPTIVTGILLGPIAGLIMGALFGIVTLVRAATAPLGVLDPLFINPLVSVLPRLLIGVMSYYGYRLMTRLVGYKSKGSKGIAAFIGAAFGSVTNTVLVMTMLYLVYIEEVVESVGIAFQVLLINVVAINSVVELIISGIITIPIVVAYQTIMRK
jgi:uncharacterized membrane protein